MRASPAHIVPAHYGLTRSALACQPHVETTAAMRFFLACLSPHVVTAALRMAGVQRDGPGFGSAVIAIPSTQWENALENPNATGHFPIQGYDLSRPYPSTGAIPQSIDGWSLDFNVTADISAANATGFELPRAADGYVTGASIRLRPPASLLTAAPEGQSPVKVDNATWQLCLNVLDTRSLPQATIDAGRKDDGSCTSMLGEQCVRDLRDRWNTCKLRAVPDSCKDAFGPFPLHGVVRE